jgi:SSS family solute:Na+ symporter
VAFDFHFFAFSFIAVYLGILIVTGLWLGRKEAAQDFIIGNRQVGIIPTAASLAASFRDGGGIAFWMAAGFAASYSGMWLLAGVLVSAVILAVIGPRLRADAARDGMITIQERVHAMVGPYSAKLSSVVSLIFGLLIISIQFHVTGNIFSEILKVPDIAGVGIVCAILILYLLAGGYKSVIVTDTIQFFVMFSLILIPFFIPPPMESFSNVQSLFEGTWGDGMAFFLIGLCYLLVSPECWQRIFSAKNDRTITAGIPLTAVLLVLMTLSLIWLGMGAKHIFPDIDKETAYSLIFQDTPMIAPWVLGYILVVFLSITMSTQSASCYGFVATLARMFFSAKTDTDKKYIRFSRVAMTVCLIASAALALSIHSVIAFLFDAMGFVICLAPLYVFSAVASRVSFVSALSAVQKMKLDMMMAGVTVAGILMFVLSMTTGLTGQGFIFAALPGLMTAVLMAAALFVFAKITRR